MPIFTRRQNYYKIKNKEETKKRKESIKERLNFTQHSRQNPVSKSQVFIIFSGIDRYLALLSTSKTTNIK